MDKIFDTIILEQEGPVAQITINRSDKLNALNTTVIEELGTAIFEHINAEVRVIVITGSGSKAFVAGADIAAMQSLSPEEALEFSRQGQSVFSALEKIPQIVIAKVRGFALGGGCELAMSCDLIIAGESSKFGQPEVNLGLIPGFGGTQRLAKRVGLPVALDILLTGKAKMLTAQQAFQLGLASRVVADEQLDNEVDEVIKAILASGPNAVAETKRLCRQSFEVSLDAGLSSEASTFATCFAGEEADEGISAFLEKRAPKF
ncbi:MAG: enoyl-CoA hydratase-related protein [Bdellovibrionota bacterium]